MTLALHGKSRRRQGTLLFGALLSLVVATVAGLFLVGSATASPGTPTLPAPGAASGDGVVPVVIAGNPSCADLNANASFTGITSNYGFKIDLSPNGTFLLDASSPGTSLTGGAPSDASKAVTISNSNGSYFNWAANFGIDAVIVKAGNDANIFIYNPEDMADTLLHGPINPQNGNPYGVSHIEFCFDNDPASVSVTKDAPAAAYNLGQSFDWTITATVANGPTTSDYAIWDDIPAQFTVNSVTESDPKITCTAALDPVSCTLESGAATGAHTITVNVTVKNDATCGPVTNNVRNGTSNAAPIEDSDTITIGGCATPSVTVDKAHSGPDNFYALGESFNYTLKFTVANGPTTSAFTAVDTVPAAFSVGTVTPASGSPLRCSTAGNVVTCVLDAGAGNGDYTATIPVTVSASATCGNVDNSVRRDSAAGTVLDTVPVTITGCATPSVTVDKAHSGADDLFALGESFNYTLKFTVANGPTSSAFTAVDAVPAAFSVGTATPDGTGSPLHCSKTGNVVTCVLDSNAANGDYSATIPVTVSTSATCGDVNNSVRKDSAAGDVLDTVAIAITGCGSINFTKQNGVLDLANNEIDWTIVITNTSVVAGSITIVDPGTSLDSETCSNAVVENPTDTYACDVPASSSVNLVLSTPLPAGFDPVCNDLFVENTATVGQRNSSGSFRHDATPDASCLEVSKTTTATSEPPTWAISIASTADDPVNVFVVDTGATFQGASGGSCTATVGVTSMTAGIACSVNAKSTLVITVTKPTAAATCEGTDVSNSASIYLGSSTDGTLVGSPGGGTHQDVNADPDLCNRVIRLCKVWQFNVALELSDGDTTFLFDVADSGPDSSTVSVSGVTEGDTVPACILLSVLPGLVSIDEQLPTGFLAPNWELRDAQGALIDSASGVSAEFRVGSESCVDNSTSGLVIGLVREVFALVREVESGDPLCTLTFFNRDEENRLPTGSLQVEKYLDINGDGDANDVALGEGLIPGWDVAIAGPALNATFDLTNGTRVFGSLTAGHVYALNEVAVAGYHVTNATVDGVSSGAVTSVNTTIPNGGTTVVRFYNQPLASLSVHKVAVTSHNGGPDIDAPNDDDGWTITLTSAACNVNLSQQTNAAGNVTFTNLPLCNDYVVAENQNNPASPGFVVVGSASYNGQRPEGQTLNFRNRRTTSDPPVTPTTPPSTPTTPPANPTTPPSTPTNPPATPTTPPATSTPRPTNTPVTTPASPTPESETAGERTPGPTPIAPSTGGGLVGGGSNGFGFLFVAAGLVVAAAGLGFAALGRKQRR